MKGVLFLCLFCTIVKLSLHSQEGWFIGFGAEANAHTRDGASAGGVLSLGLDSNSNFALGLKAAFYYNFDPSTGSGLRERRDAEPVEVPSPLVLFSH